MEQAQYEELRKYVRTEEISNKSKDWDTFDHESISLDRKVHVDL